jgi:hypothetical protein
MNSKTGKYIVICGSMSNYPAMVNCHNFLQKNNIPSILPYEENDIAKNFSEQELYSLKREVSRKHFDSICDDKTFAILVVNTPKNSKKNYIGANTFAEIAISFYCKKRIFLLDDIYEEYKDELIAWETQPLQGSIEKLINAYKSLAKIEAKV